jgi:phosphopantetheine--protein transferase-like protein
MNERMSRVHVFYTAVPDELAQATEEQALARLSVTHREQLVKRLGRVRMASLAGLSMLMAGLSAAEIDRDLADLQFTADGKPFWPRGPHFSISHAGLYAGCALAAGASAHSSLGFDIEQIRPLRRNVMARMLSAEELASAQDDPVAMYQLWSAKEAVVKAVGVGLRKMAQVRIEGDHAHLDDATWHLHRQVIDTDHVACVAVSASGIDVQTQRITMVA